MRIDLNLLNVLHTLVEERNVSRAAARLGVGQPAVSNALARLRHQVGDPLLVRTGRGMEPTARALDLVVPVREALEAMNAIAEGARRFDPRTYAGELSIAAVDYATQVFAPEFAHRLRGWAPRAVVRVVRAHANERDTAAKARECHLVLSDARIAPGVFHSVPLLTDDWRIIFRAGHPLDGAKVDAAALVRYGFVASRMVGDDLRAVADEVFAAYGLRRRIAVNVPNSGYAGAVVASTSHVALMVRRVAERAQQEYGVRAIPCPVPMPPIRVMLYWQRRHEASPLHRWLRERALEVAASL